MKYSISTKIIAIILFVMLFISLSSYYLLEQIYKQNLERGIFKAVRQAGEAFNYHEKEDTEKLSSALRVFMENREFKEVYLAKDRDRLYEYGWPLFKDLKERYGITHFYFHLPEGRTFVRLHDKKIYGDYVNRITFRKARDTGTFGAGLELGKTAFALRVVAPYYKEDKLIGYVELGEEIDHFLAGLKGKTNNEFAIVAKKEHLSREDWKSVRKAAGLPDNWDELEKYIRLGSPAKNPVAKACFMSENLEAFEKGASFISGFSGLSNVFACGGFPIQDAGGRPVGVVMALIDVSEHIALEKKMHRQTASVFLFFSVLLFIILFILIRRLVSKPIEKMSHAANSIAAGSFDHRLEIKARDEIGGLASAFNNMAEELQKTMVSRNELVKGMEERKRAEEALRESGETLKAILNATTDALFLIDAEGKILILNETTALRLGKTKDELIGACIYDHLPPDNARSRRAYVNEAVSSGKIVHFEDERNGEWIDHSIYPLFDEQGKIARIAIYGRYITERKLAEDKLKKAYQELKTSQRATLNIMEDIAFKKKELEALYLTARISGSTMDLHKLLYEILQTIIGLDLFGVERKGGVFVMEGDRMKLVSHIGFQDSFIELHKDMKAGDCLCGLAAETGEVVISKDSNKDDRHTISYEGMTSHGHIVVPLKAANTLHGVLCLYVPADIELDHGKINLLEAIGSQTGVALENMRLYKESVEKTEYLERFNRLMVGREIEMIKLKAEVNELLEKDGQPKKYEAPDEAEEVRNERDSL